MNKYLYKFSIVTYIISSFFVVYNVFAVDLNYPDFTDASSPGEFVGKLYIYALSIAATLAVIMIVYGGVKYVASAGSVAAQGDARDIIKNSLFGILLLGGAYLILNTINPSITSLKNPDLPPIATSTDLSSHTNYDNVTDNEYEDAEARAILMSAGINVTSSGYCTDPTNPACTSLQRIPKGAVCKLVHMHNACSCSMIITAGTEVGHLEHGPGMPVVDLRFTNTLDNYIYEQIGTTDPALNHRYSGSDSNSYIKEGDHWHVRLQVDNCP